eukprot:759706-Hanusia_phi.AAC.2
MEQELELQQGQEAQELILMGRWCRLEFRGISPRCCPSAMTRPMDSWGWTRRLLGEETGGGAGGRRRGEGGKEAGVAVTRVWGVETVGDRDERTGTVVENREEKLKDLQDGAEKISPCQTHGRTSLLAFR